jgi:protein-disulfide isomerase
MVARTIKSLVDRTKKVLYTSYTQNKHTYTEEEHMKAVKAAKVVEKRESIEAKTTSVSVNSLVSMIVSNFGTGLLIIAAFLVGMLFTEVKYLKKGVGSVPTAAAPAAQAPAAAAPEVPLTAEQLKEISTNPVFELGNKNAKVTMVEFTDYQCPFCARHFTDTYPSIIKDYVDTGKIRLVFRDLPLSFHPNAKPAAIAARCAGKQNKYEAMHDKLFGSQAEWSSLAADAAKTKFAEYAGALGVNANTFTACLADASVAKAVDDDAALAAKVGATGTPTFFINEERVVGAYPLAEFKTRLDAALK